MNAFRIYMAIANVWFAASFVAPDNSWLASILGFIWLGMAVYFQDTKD